MSSFKSIQDAAFALKAEGQEIKIKFSKGVPNTGQGTVDWTIPPPAQGCESGESGVYAGILILISPKPMTGNEIPTDGTIYIPDPTADYDLSTADKIGDAYVVGAFYECEKKGKGDALTTTLIINDIAPGEAYYVAGYALDCQNRYHKDGIRTYSDRFGSADGDDLAATQIVELGELGQGVLPTDGTGLLPGALYEFDIIYDNTFPEGTDFKTIPVTINGLDAGTYEHLLVKIRDAISLVNNPAQSPTAPFAGSFYWNGMDENLFQYDGQQYESVESINEATDPSIIVDGVYWYNPTTPLNQPLEILKLRSAGVWTDVTPSIISEADPLNPACDTYWYDYITTIGKRWDGSVWCEEKTTASIEDPSACPILECGAYWFDEGNNILAEWNEDNLKWDEVAAILWPEDPQNLSDGTYWFDNTLEEMFIRDTSAWDNTTNTVKIQVEEPDVVVDGLLWYDPLTEILKKYSSSAPIGWAEVPVLVWPEDPSNTESCDLWWNTLTDELFTWDTTNVVWAPVANFIQSSIDPAAAPIINIGDLWYSEAIPQLFAWEGNKWLPVDYMATTIDPTISPNGTAWFKKSTNTWSILTAGAWVVIDPIDADFDPTTMPLGTYWFDTTNQALFTWNGSPSWISVPFTTQPISHPRGEQWYDTDNNILYEWNGIGWEEATPVVTVLFNRSGGFTFTTTEKGSQTAVLIPAPEGNVSGKTPCSIGTGYAFYGVDDIAGAQCQYQNSSSVGRVYPARDIPNNSYLWSNLTIPAGVLLPNGGNDGQSGVPSYLEQGVGTDGSPDERRELMDSIRRQLGHPVVEVELDNVQLDTCVNIALETFRQRSGAATRRGFFFLEIAAGKQQYLMTNKVIGYNRIVTVLAAYRFTSAFLSSAHGAGAYGQIVLQHLYNMGTYDLTSFFLVSQYVEQLEMMFATRLTYSFHENNRMLSFFSAFTRQEKVLLDCMVERTEQDLLKDRYTKIWLERYALSQAMIILSQIRGKYATLPGAGGGVSLNATELLTLGESYREDCLLQLEDYIADTPEDVGMQGTFILG